MKKSDWGVIAISVGFLIFFILAAPATLEFLKKTHPQWTESRAEREHKEIAQSIYDSGYAAGKMKISAAANPYTWNVDRVIWLDGYMAGMKDAQ